jgi:hypothetical protein
MGLLDVFKGQYPSGDWEKDPALAVEFDFDHHTLCGVRVGSPVERFRPLGPAEDKSKARKGVLCYYSKGFSVEARDDQAVEFVLGFGEGWGGLAPRSASPFKGPIRYRGGQLQLGPQTTDVNIMTQFGPPAASDQRKGGEKVLKYAIRDVTYAFEFSGKKLLQTVSVTAEAES